ncbi:hypothetical protein Tco_1358543, partial [Tanacetum coccineum]
PTSSPHLHLFSTVHRADRPEVTLLPRKRLGVAFGSRYEVGESLSAPTARPPGELGQRMTEFTTRVRQDTYEIYTMLDDEQTERQLMAGWLNMLYRDRRAKVMSLRTQVVAQQAMIIELQAADRRR